MSGPEATALNCAREKLAKPSLADLHRRIQRGDVAALNALAERLLSTVPRLLRRRFPRASLESLMEAVEDAILEYSGHLDRVDLTANGGTRIDRLVQYAASRNVINLLQSEARRRAREAYYANELARHNALRPWNPAYSETRTEILRRLLPAITNIAERKAFVSMLDEAPALEVADALGLSHLPIGERRRAVKQFRERIIKRLSRRCRRE